MNDESSLEQHRQQFPALANKAYFNYGGQGPLANVALQAILDAYHVLAQTGPFSIAANNWLMQTAQQTRQAIAAELAVATETITLTENVSMGCNIVLWGLDWQAGDRVLLSDCEHYGVIAAVQELQRRFNLEVSTCPLSTCTTPGEFTATITQHLQPRTRLVILSHILWNTGQVLPLAEIATACHNYSAGHYPVSLLIDAAQSVGVLPLDLTQLDVDFYAFTGHKWWCGPAGVGGLYVRPESLSVLQPTFVGWRNVLLDNRGQPKAWKPDGRRFEIATAACPLYKGLQAAIAIHPQWRNPQKRYQRIQTLSHYLWQQLREIPGVTCLRTVPPDAGLVSFQVANHAHQALVQFLEERNIQLRTLPDPSCVRACVHYFTLETEIEQLIAAVDRFCQQTSA